MTGKHAERVKQIANAVNFDNLETLMPQNRDDHNTNCITYKRARPAAHLLVEPSAQQVEGR